MTLMVGINQMLFTDYKIRQRHELLARTIGAKKEEEASRSASNTLVITATVVMIVCSILEVVLYRLYNRKVQTSYPTGVNIVSFSVPSMGEDNKRRASGLWCTGGGGEWMLWVLHWMVWMYGQKDFVTMNHFYSSSCRKEDDIILDKNENKEDKVLEEEEEENRGTKVVYSS